MLERKFDVCEGEEPKMVIYKNVSNKDDIVAAISGLDQFTKNYCMNVAETEKLKDLIFRCDNCEFLDKDTKLCIVKLFANKRFKNNQELKDYDSSSFGSMGSL